MIDRHAQTETGLFPQYYGLIGMDGARSFRRIDRGASLSSGRVWSERCPSDFRHPELPHVLFTFVNDGIPPPPPPKYRCLSGPKTQCIRRNLNERKTPRPPPSVSTAPTTTSTVPFEIPPFAFLSTIPPTTFTILPPPRTLAAGLLRSKRWLRFWIISEPTATTPRRGRYV